MVVEGVDPAQTSVGPGHVPGTAGLGQPGNSVLVVRHKGYGAAFERLGRLREGDQIVVTTTQGQSVYDVTVVRHVRIAASTDAPGSAVETPVHLDIGLGATAEDDARLGSTVRRPTTG